MSLVNWCRGEFVVRCTDIYKVVIDWGKGKRESTDEGCRRDGRSEKVWKGYRRIQEGTVWEWN